MYWRVCIYFAALVLMATKFIAAQELRDTTKPCSDEGVINLRVERPGYDWASDLVSMDKSLGEDFPFRDVPDGRTGFYGRRMEAKSGSIALPRISFRECNHTALLDSFTLHPVGAIAIGKEGRFIAIIVWGDLRTGTGKNAAGVGGSMNVVLYDMHGSGHFDTLQSGATLGLPYIPAWVK
ncbi:MAG TPA: hypothetical protein VG225_04050 [Terracidiphilus sp.]|jgi:hypothetical protein|nr:hypothetical protein [Terracidiphilus sp.]